MTSQFLYIGHGLVKGAGHSLGQHLSHQFVSLLPLHLQLLCPLSNQILQVGGVLLQHAQHRVDDVGLLSLRDALELSCEQAGEQECDLQLATFIHNRRRMNVCFSPV